MKRTSTAIWNGLIVDGNGPDAGPGCVFNEVPVCPPSCAKEARSIQLLAAVHLDCFSLMLSEALAGGDCSPKKLKVAADLALNNIVINGWILTRSHLVFAGKIFDPNIAPLERLAVGTRDNFPLSRVLDGPAAFDAHVSEQSTRCTGPETTKEVQK